MDEETFKARTKHVALAVIQLCTTLPRSLATDTISRQLIRSGTSVGANYRAACRARSKPDLIAKLGVVEEEADESIYWLELLIDSGALAKPTAMTIRNEMNEILAMTVASIRTLRQHSENPKSKIQNPK